MILQNLEHFLKDRNEIEYICIIIVALLLLSIIPINILIILSIIIYIIISYSQLKEISGLKNSDSEINYEQHKIEYNDILEEHMKDLKQYQNYNKDAYKKGVRKMKKFIKLIRNIEEDQYEHPRQKFENAELYLKDSINHFQSITMSIPEMSHQDHIEHKDKQIKSEELGKLCTEIYNDCYNILHNVALRLNDTYWNKINKYQIKIEYNHTLTEPHNLYNEYELY